MALGCCTGPPPARSDPNATAISARFGTVELHWIIHRTVEREQITCGYAGLGSSPFIARSGEVYLEDDLGPGQFSLWEDRLCGPDWVKPVRGMPLVP